MFKNKIIHFYESVSHFQVSYSPSFVQILKYKGLLALYINYKMQDFPAQKMACHQERMNRMPTPQDLITQTVRAKYDALKAKAPVKYNMVRAYQPINLEKYNELVAEFKDFLENMQEGETKDVKKYLPLIFGALQGSCSLNEPEDILAKKFGQNIEKLNIEEIVKGKLKNVNVANDKRRQTNLRQVSNKEVFESVGQLYDLKEMKIHRKICNNVKNYLKSMKKFMEAMKNSELNEIFNQNSPQNISYIEFANEEISYNKLKIPSQVLGIDSDMNDEKEEKGEEAIAEKLITPCKKQTVVKSKEDTASGQKIEEVDNQQNKSSSNQQNEKKPKEKDAEGKVRIRRTKEEIEREKQAKAREKEQKLLEKERIEKEKQLKLQEKEKERIMKEKQKQAEREAKERERQAKEREKQAKEREKEAERVARQAERLAKQAERKAKEAAKEAERIAKQKKNNPGQSLKLWLKPTEHSSPQKNENEDKEDVSQSNILEDEKNNFISSINSNKMEVSELRKMFLTQKMKNEESSFEPYYSTVYTHKSRLEFNRFFINQQRFKEYFHPHEQYENGKYDDSSVEYEDFCGDFCDEKMDEMSVEDEQASFNSAIVPDSYISEDEISSLNESKDHVDVKIDQGAEWYFNNSNNYTADRYTMFCCLDDEPLPLPLNEPEQSNELSLAVKCELYKEIHGYYGPKDSLIKKLALITDKVPKSYLDTLIKETTTKRGYQRLVKPEIIDFLNEQRDTFAKQLEDIKNKRDEDNMIEMRGKMNEKQREIERLILEEAGTYYIIDMLHFLREKGYRMLKRELKEFIDARTGQVWDDVRKKMGRMQLKSKEKISPFLAKKDKENKAEGTEEIKEEKMDKEEKNEKEEEIKVFIEEQQPEMKEGVDKKDDQNKKEEKMQPEP